MSPVENEDEREIFARYGLAMFMAQVLEHEIVNTLTVLQKLPTRESIKDADAWAISVDEFMDAQHANTFGTMLKAMEKTGLVPDDVMQDLKVCRSDRDFLAHNFFRHYANGFMSHSGRQEMLDRVDQARQRFSAVNVALERFKLPLMERFGITQEALDHEYEQLVSELDRS